MKSVVQIEHRASSSRGKHEGESSFGLCDRLSRTRDNSQRQLPTDQDYAVPTREYQTDQSSLKTAPTAVRASILHSIEPHLSALSVRQGGSGSAALTVTDVNGFNGSVSLSIAGLSTGVTAVFSPSTITSAGTISFASTSIAAAGSYPLTITGTYGTLTSTVAISLSVVVPSFSLSASSSALTIPRGASGSSVISVIGQNGFNGSVTLSAIGVPSGVTVAFSPISTTSASTLTVSVSSTATTGTFPVTITGISGSLKQTSVISLTVTAPNFSVTFQPDIVLIPRGYSSNSVVMVAPQNGFQGVVRLSGSGFPSGITATYGNATSGVIPVVISASSTATAGTSSITLVATSGSLTNMCSFQLTVLAAPAGTALVNLSPAYNVNALVVDGISFGGGGLDGGLNGSSTAYSDNLFGSQQTIAGTLFVFGPAETLDAVSSKTITLPSGQYSKLSLLATAVNGNQLSQVFKVIYTDGTVTTLTQSLSDWFTPQGFVGETTALKMAYRDNSQGQRDTRTSYLDEYVFTLNSAKTVASVVLPNNRNVVVLAASLTGGSAGGQSSQPTR
jgi:hypothetical protein